MFAYMVPAKTRVFVWESYDTSQLTLLSSYAHCSGQTTDKTPKSIYTILRVSYVIFFEKISEVKFQGVWKYNGSKTCNFGVFRPLHTY